MDEVYLGTICLFAFGFDPVCFLPCNGQSLSIQQYSALYSLLGFKYGGSGNYFNLPNLNGTNKVPNQMIYCIASDSGCYPVRP